MESDEFQKKKVINIIMQQMQNVTATELASGKAKGRI